MDNESKYTKIEKIGQGAYGAVYKAINQQNGKLIALKISKFEDFQQGVPSTCLRQVSVIKKLDHPALVKLLNAKFFTGTNPRVQMQFQFVDYDLSKYIKIFPQPGTKAGISQASSKKMIKDILQGIQYLHVRGVIHRDLKPNNILVTKEGKIKIADYGLARLCSHPLQIMSKQIQTLWYRAPQLLLGAQNYDWGVDTWSVGCIFYQIIEGVALFRSQCQIGQLFQIFKILGTPSRNQWPQIINMPQFRGSLPKFKPNPPVFKKMSFSGQQFLWKLLRPNPKQRLTVNQALRQKYMENV